MSSSTYRIESLTQNNYDTWKMQVQALLFKNDAWDYVNGNTKKPEIVEGDAASIEQARLWDIGDGKAKSDLILAITPSELKQIKGCITSHQVWLKLESIYQSKGPARKATLLKQLTLQKMQEGDNVRQHLHSFFDAVDKLHEMEVKINPELLAIMLLYSLPKSFDNFRCAIESRDELPTPEALKVKILEENDARQQKTKEGTQNAMVASDPKWKSKGSRFNKSSEENPRRKYEVRCYGCNKTGHIIRNCPQKNTSEKVKAKKVEEESFLATEKTALKAERVVSRGWCLDSGCTSHMCNVKEIFTSIESSTSEKLSLANGESTDIKAKGEVRLAVSDNLGDRYVKLKNTLFVPDLQTNLMSVSKVTDNGFKVIFDSDKAVVENSEGDVKLIANRVNDLYYVQSPIDSEKAKQASEKTATELTLTEWHSRFGHLNEESLKQIVKNNLALGINFDISEKLSPCEICVKGKMVRQLFPKSQLKSTEILEIVHSDVCGPMRVESIGGSRYVATFVDDHTRWCEVRFLKRKSDVLTEFVKYKTRMENLTGKRIKFLQSDNGGEYCNREFDEYLEDHGIGRRLTAPYTPEQNGLAERKNRTLLEVARCMLIEGGLLSGFWAEAIHTANYVKNRTPSKSINNATPFWKLTGRHPVVAHFRSFGSKVFVLEKKPGMDKFKPRSYEGIFVGYSEEAKAYRVWNPERKIVVITRDVKFMPKSITHTKFEEFEPDPQINPQDQQQENDEVPFEGPEVPMRQAAGNNQRRGRGRPRTIRTGEKGRPRKEYQMIPENIIEEEEVEENIEIADLAEISLKEAINSSDHDEWKAAMCDEVKSLLKNNTWTVVDKPINQSIVTCRFTLRNKPVADGSQIKKKARLVARGFSQREGIDYHETFSPVARMSSIRLMMAIATNMKMKIHQLDVSSAFLNGDLEEDVFMNLPEFFEEIIEKISAEEKKKKNLHSYQEMRKILNSLRSGNKVLKLNKAIYGLKQAGRQWNLKFDNALREIGLTPCDTDHCFYHAERNGALLLVIIYVDDMLISCQDLEWMYEVERNLMNKFEMRNLGNIKYCLGINFNWNNGNMEMSQQHYINEILERFGMSESKSVLTPFETGKQLIKPENPSADIMAKYPYRQLVGSLMYLAVSTRPDLMFAVSSLSQFNDSFGEDHWIAAKRVLRYVKGTASYGIVFKKGPNILQGYVDSDWGASPEDRRSCTGFAFKFGNSTISWESRKQRSVALSSTEAEYMALSEATKESIYLSRLINELGISMERTSTIFCDNQGAMKLAKNPIYHGRTKHIDIRYHFVREAIQNELIEVKYLCTEDMIADVMTKGLCKVKHKRCMDNLSFVNICPFD